jgi:hypothetical protein
VSRFSSSGLFCRPEAIGEPLHSRESTASLVIVAHTPLTAGTTAQHLPHLLPCDADPSCYQLACNPSFSTSHQAVATRQRTDSDPCAAHRLD